MDFPSTPRLPLFTSKAVRAIDAEAIHRLGGNGIDLMERAGAAAFECITRWRPQARTLSAMAGRGNNGGDAYIVARRALEAGWDVRLYPSSPGELPQGDAAIARERYLAAGGPILNFIPEDFEAVEILVDGLFGTGLDRPIEGHEALIIEAANRYRERGLGHATNRRTLIALDIPSGLHADRGCILGTAIRADLTITFVQPKPGLFTGMGPSCAGHVDVSPLGIDADVLRQQKPCAELMGWIQSAPLLRSRESHKGCFGHVLLVGGAPGYSGAVRLAGEAALRTGAGLVSVATHPDHAATLNQGRPELMVRGVDKAEDLDSLLEKATVVAIGPGLGQSGWGKALLDRILAVPLPLVVDADALNLLSEPPPRAAPWVLTPHPGEAARLLGQSSQEIQENRFLASLALSERFEASIVLKGAGSIVAERGRLPRVIPLGNPGMASGGMGDVLTGVIAALIAQGLEAFDAATLGVILHGGAADALAQEEGERGLLALDLPPRIRLLLNTPSQLQPPRWPTLCP
jgi:NAD(P)H-hydrate epimerase